MDTFGQGYTVVSKTICNVSQDGKMYALTMRGPHGQARSVVSQNLGHARLVQLQVATDLVSVGLDLVVVRRRVVCASPVSPISARAAERDGQAQNVVCRLAGHAQLVRMTDAMDTGRFGVVTVRFGLARGAA